MLKIILAILLFTVIVVFHELGHFLLAKWNGVCVEEFAIGIGPTLIGKKIGETVYGIKALPFGGCCVMKGEDGDDTSEGSLNSKTPLQRFSIIFAGPFFNFILAFFFGMILVAMAGVYYPVIGQVEKNGGAYEAGLKEGDEILKMDHARMHEYTDISLYNFFHSDHPEVEITYRRDGEIHKVTVVRKMTDGRYICGIYGPEKPVRQGPAGIVRYGWYEMVRQINMTFQSLRMLVTGKASPNDLSGPVGIVNTIGESYDASIVYGIKVAFMTMLSFAILLSANLGVMNLLPLPALDGGRLVFIILEMIRGKKIDPEKEGMVHFAGLILLLTLMVLVMGNDIRKIFMH